MIIKEIKLIFNVETGSSADAITPNSKNNGENLTFQDANIIDMRTGANAGEVIMIQVELLKQKEVNQIIYHQ